MSSAPEEATHAAVLARLRGALATSKTPPQCICGAPGASTCAGCEAVDYCGVEHQAAHWQLGHAHACTRAKARLSALRAQPLAAWRAELAACAAEAARLEVLSGQCILANLALPGGEAIATVFAAAPRGAAYAAEANALGERARAAGDRALAHACFVAGAGDAAGAGGVPEAMWNCGLEYLELGGGASGAGRAPQAMAAGLYWLARALEAGAARSPQRDAELERARQDQARVLAAEAALKARAPGP